MVGWVQCGFGRVRTHYAAQQFVKARDRASFNDSDASTAAESALPCGSAVLKEDKLGGRGAKGGMLLTCRTAAEEWCELIGVRAGDGIGLGSSWLVTHSFRRGSRLWL